MPTALFYPLQIYALSIEILAQIVEGCARGGPFFDTISICKPWPIGNLEDLLEVSNDVPVLVEGYKLLPRLVSPLLSRADQAIWLIPTPELRRVVLCRRGSLWSIAGRTSDPQTALATYLRVMRSTQQR
jgi:hypothetical protein